MYEAEYENPDHAAVVAAATAVIAAEEEVVHAERWLVRQLGRPAPEFRPRGFEKAAMGLNVVVDDDGCFHVQDEWE